MLTCPICEDCILEAVVNCSGQFNHCEKTFRFVAKNTEYVVWEHSRDAYNPARIWADIKLTLKQKELRLAHLYSSLSNMEYEYRQIIHVNMESCKDYLSKTRKHLLNAQVADQISSPTFKVNVNWGNKSSFTRVWQQTLMMWAKAHASAPIHVYEKELADIVGCVRFARANGIDIPVHLQSIQ